MILGCDIGSSVTKAVILQDRHVIASLRVPTDAHPDRAMGRVLEGLRERHKIDDGDIEETAITGWGEPRVSLPHTAQSVLGSLARASQWDRPACRAVLCLGAQNTAVLSVNDKGRVMEYRMNDKCASGCGKFLEIMFEALAITVEDSAAIASASDKRISLSGQCAVFYESDVVSLINAGESVANITEAILDAVTRTVATLCKKIKIADAIVVGGGLANNKRLLDGVGALIQRPLHVFGGDPDLIGAIGAALGAQATR
ncbi:MAG: hypothetical protein HY899_16940 [Deltaproteobacteria bacterium]|nr:hypothetical protein [Deltaproteobacteria bacterium]